MPFSWQFHYIPLNSPNSWTVPVQKNTAVFVQYYVYYETVLIGYYINTETNLYNLLTSCHRRCVPKNNLFHSPSPSSPRELE